MKIEINEELAKELQDFLEESSFKELDGLINFILEDYLDTNKIEKENDPDKDILQQRLKNLGYL